MMSSRSCSTCGAPLSASARFCPVCGTTAPEPDASGAPAPAGATGAPTTPVLPYQGLPQPAFAGPYQPVGFPQGPARRTPGTATAALIMGLMTWLLPFVLIGLLTFWVTAPLAVGCGVAARRTIESDPEKWSGSGQANTGLALGLSAMILATLILSMLVFSRLG